MKLKGVNLPLVLTLTTTLGLAISPVWDYDVWFQLACGRAILELGGLPRYDLFSYTAASHPWDSQEWLSQVLLYGAYRCVGLTGLTVLKATVAALMLFVVFRHAAARARLIDSSETWAWTTAILCIWAAYSMRWSLTERPQMFSMLLLALMLWLLAERRRLWLLIPITLLWANLHGGSVLIAPGVLALWIAGQTFSLIRRGEPLASLKRPGLIWFALLAAIMANPAGLSLFRYPFETMSDTMYMLNILEWTPPTLSDHPSFFLMLTLAALVLMLTFRSWQPADLLIAGTFAVLALNTRRHIPLFCLAVLPPLSAALTHALTPVLARFRSQQRTTAVLAWLAGAGVLALTAWRGEALQTGIRLDLYPAGAIRHLHEAVSTVEAATPGGGLAAADDAAHAKPALGGHEPIRIFGLHKWGGYLLWHLSPACKVFIDGRQIVYGKELYLNYYKILENTPEAGELLKRYDPDLFILDYRRGAKLSHRLASSGAAALIYWDDTCVVYAKRSARHEMLIKQKEYRAFHPARAPSPDLAANLADLERAAREAPTHARPWSLRAGLLLSHQRLDEAWTAASEALQRAPRILPILLTAFEVALARSDLDEARALLKRATRLDESGTSSSLARAKLALTDDRPGDARRAVEQAVKAGEAWQANRKSPEPALAEVYQLKAWLLNGEGKPAGAADALRKAGNVSYRLGYLAAAQISYEAGLALAPSDMRLLHNLGALQAARGHYEAALLMYLRALKLAPQNPDTHVAIGVAHYHLGRMDRARAAWREALRIEPGHDDAGKYLRRVGLQ